MSDSGKVNNDLFFFLQNEAKPLVEKFLKQEKYNVRDLIQEIRDRFQTKTHSRDIMDSFGFVVQKIAEVYPEVLVKALDDDSLAPDPTRVIIASALSKAAPSHEALEALERASKHKNRELSNAASQARMNMLYEGGPEFYR